MDGRVVVDRFTRGVVVVGVAFTFVAIALADPRPSTGGVTITVFDDRYVVGDLAFDDLDYLETHTDGTRVRSVELLICGARATRALKAAVHRFRHVPVQMRVPDADEHECMSKASLVTPARPRVGQRPFGIDDQAVERYWLDMMP